MYQMICLVLEGFQAMEGLDASDGAGTGAEILMKFEEVYGRTRHGVLGQAEVAEILGVSERTFRRWRERYEADGAEGLYDRRLGRVLARRAPVDEVARVLALFVTRYWDFTAKHFHEKLVAEHGCVHDSILGWRVHRRRAHVVAWWSSDDHRRQPAGPGGALRHAKQAPPPENLIGVQVVALGHHRHRDPRLMGLRNDLTLLRLAPPPATAANLPAALSDRHQPGIHLAISGHLRSAHSQTTQPAQTYPIRTGGLRRRLAVRLAKAWWSGDAWRCPEFPHNPFRGHSESHIGR